jgi:hypothetical protein
LFLWIAWVSRTFFRFVNSLWKGFILLCFESLFPPFGEIVFYPNWKDL